MLLTYCYAENLYIGIFFVRGWVNPDKPITQDLGISEDLFLSQGHNKNLSIFVITLSSLGSTVRQIFDCLSPEVTLIKIMFAVHSTSKSDLAHVEHKSHHVTSRSNHTTTSKKKFWKTLPDIKKYKYFKKLKYILNINK